MYIDVPPGKIHGCFHCGEVLGDYSFNDEGAATCGSCGEDAIITFETALDMMIELQRQGHIFQPIRGEDLDETELDLDPEDDDDWSNNG